jgi:hypothetical protein
MSNPTKSLATVKAVSLQSGSDAKVAAELIKGFQLSQKAGRVIMAFGLFAWEVKETRLKHGQWGDWLATHAPTLCRVDDKTGKPKALSAVSTYMQMTKDVLEDMGFTIEKYFKHLSNSHGLGICHDGKFLLAPAKKLPKEAAELQKQFCDRVDGKTMKQIRLAFGQVEEDAETGDLKAKRGRLKNSSGLTKEQRAAAAAKAHAAEILELATRVENFGAEADELADAAHIGNPEIAEAFEKAYPQIENLWRFVQQTKQGRK